MPIDLDLQQLQSDIDAAQRDEIPEPQIGDIVHYYQPVRHDINRDTVHLMTRAAIITGVMANKQVSLYVFGITQVFDSLVTPYCTEPTAGCWSYKPTRVVYTRPR